MGPFACNCFPRCSLYGPCVARLRSAAGPQLISGQTPVYSCCRPRRVFSRSALIWARPDVFSGGLQGGPVYSKAGPVYFRVGHAGLPCVFPDTLFLYLPVAAVFPGVRCSGHTPFAFNWLVGVQPIPGQGQGSICCSQRGREREEGDW